MKTIIQNINFPVNVFPPTIQTLIEEASVCLGLSKEYLGTSVLFSASVSVGLTAEIEVAKGWTELPIVYVALVGPSSAKKSRALKLAVQPIEDFDSESYSDYQQKKSPFDNDQNLTPDEKKQYIGSETEKQRPKKHLIKSSTTEALIQDCAYNPRGLGYYKDELSDLFKNNKQYSNGPDKSFWLTAWNGSYTDCNRKTNDEYLRVSKTFISVSGGMTLSGLSELSKNGRAENGYLQRILFAFCPNEKKRNRSERQLSEQTIEQYSKLIKQLLDVEPDLDHNGNPKPMKMRIKDGADKKAAKDWEDQNIDVTNKVADETLAGMYSKLEAYFYRFCVLLQRLEDAENNNLDNDLIHEETVNKAINLVEYFRKTAKVAHC